LPVELENLRRYLPAEVCILAGGRSAPSRFGWPLPLTAMHIQTFHAEQWLPHPPEEVFRFFSDARNLQAITPAWLDFTVLTSGTIAMKPGTLIDYQLRLHGIPLGWTTEITVWEPPLRFVDEQRQGPYRLWIHEHRFAPRGDGTLATDDVRYSVPGGRLIDRLFVRRDVQRIFAFRRKRLEQILG
jgi:ligand-binding SRPBCC domain-containing protein